ncbi:MAG TPA: hypothetical protein VGN61_16705 [Verrucomicrobiae bacterium]|jgi:hypothetical protein
MREIQNFNFSITVHAEDRNLIGNLSVLAWIAEFENPRQIHIEGQVGGNWDGNGHQAVFHFSSAEIRQQFIEMSTALYGGAWSLKDQRDNDPPYDSN